MKRFSNFSDKKNIGNADIISSPIGSVYELIKSNDHLDSGSILKSVNENENGSIIFEVGVGLGEYHFIDEQNNFYTLVL